MKLIMGFDLGTTLGVAAARDDGSFIGSRTIHLPSGNGRMFATFGELVTRLLTKAHGQTASVVVWEEVVGLKSTAWQRIYFGQRALLLEACERLSIAYVPVTPQQIKRTATGKANAKKEEVMRLARIAWPLDPPGTHDEADARFAIVSAWDSMVEHDLIRRGTLFGYPFVERR